MSELVGDLSGLPEKGLVIVGFSGGADSTALSHWLMRRLPEERILLAHVNHMLRGKESERDEAACREFARRMGLRFVVSRVDIGALAEERHLGLEECGRQERYAFFQSLASGEDDRILTAHNADDNVETLLLHLCRGTGLSGLCGIPSGRGNILRPFLKVGREEIEEYCRENKLSYVQDSSNFSDDFSRNKLRLSVLPVLKEINPRAREKMGQTMELLTRDYAFLQEEAKKLLEKARAPHGLKAGVLSTAPRALLTEALKLWLEEQCGMGLEKKHLDSAEQCLFEGGAVSLPGGVTLRRGHGILSAVREGQANGFSVGADLGKTELSGGKVLVLEKKEAPLWEKGQKIHNLLFKTALDCDTIQEMSVSGRPLLTARSRLPGDRFSPVGRKLSKSLKQLFQEAGVPPGLREEAVLLECGGKLVYCEGVGPAEGFQVTGKTKELLLVTVERNG